jgi:UDP-glucose 4-epimerase
VSTVVITGASGFIGGRLTAQFLEQGWEVRALSREPAPWLSVEHHVCDLADESATAKLARALKGADTVVHLAGANEVTASTAPAAALGTTVVGTDRVAEACASSGVRRLVYLSTVHVYGARIQPGVTLTEDMRPEPRAVYGISRLASEHVAASVADGHYELVALRLTNSVGAPYDARVDRWTLVATDLCRQGALTGELKLRSSGVQWRDFVSLRDVCASITTASDPSGGVAQGTYNLGSGKPLTILALTGMIQDAFERQTGNRPPLHAPAPSSDPPGPYNVSVDRAAGSGLRLDTPLEDAVAETVGFCLEHFA